MKIRLLEWHTLTWMDNRNQTEKVIWLSLVGAILKNMNHDACWFWVGKGTFEKVGKIHICFLEVSFVIPYLASSTLIFSPGIALYSVDYWPLSGMNSFLFYLNILPGIHDRILLQVYKSECNMAFGFLISLSFNPCNVTCCRMQINLFLFIHEMGTACLLSFPGTDECNEQYEQYCSPKLAFKYFVTWLLSEHSDLVVSL